MIATFSTMLEHDCATHVHDFHELVLGETGGAFLCVDDEAAVKQRYPINNRQSLLVSAGLSHRYVAAGDHRKAKIHFICFDDSLIDQYVHASIKPLVKRMLGKGTTAAVLGSANVNANMVIALRLIAVLEERRGYYQDVAVSLLNLLLVNHVNAHDHPPNTELTRKNQQIELVMTWVQNNLASDINVDNAAAQAAMSRTVFTKSFRQHTNKSFAEYVSQIRIETAADLLLQGNMAVTDVPYQCGFRNLGHFYKQFKQQYGMTPGKFQRMSADMGLLSGMSGDTGNHAL